MNLEFPESTDENNNPNLDQLDLEILSVLKKNSRISLIDLSEKLQKHINTIRQRKRKLENNKIIKKYTIRIDFEKLNYQPILFFLKNNKENSPKLPNNFPFNIFIKTFDNKTIILTFFPKDNFISNLDEYLTFFEKNDFQVEYSIVKTLKEE